MEKLLNTIGLEVDYSLPPEMAVLFLSFAILTVVSATLSVGSRGWKAIWAERLYPVFGVLALLSVLAFLWSIVLTTNHYANGGL